jgi:hypothetical protein
LQAIRNIEQRIPYGFRCFFRPPFLQENPMNINSHNPIQKAISLFVRMSFLVMFCFGMSGSPAARAQEAATPAPNDTHAVNTATLSDGIIPPTLEPSLSADGMTTYHNGSRLVVVIDPNPAMQGIQVPVEPEVQAAIDAAVADPDATSAAFSFTFMAAGATDPWGAVCQNFPAEAQTAFNAAAAIWAATIQSPVPITISACWSSLSSSTTLGYSGWEPIHHDFPGAPKPNTYYYGSLANALNGSDLNPTAFDDYITYNSGFSWYYGTDGVVPAGQVDLVTVAAHEIAHGLNFSGSEDYSSGTGFYGDGTLKYPEIFDTFLEDAGGTKLTAYANPSTALGTLLTSNSLWFNGTNANAANGGSRVKIYAPSSWKGGSSASHLDYDTFKSPNINSMMVYQIASGFSNHNPGPVTKGLLKDLGWVMAGGGTYTLSVTKAGTGSGTVTSSPIGINCGLTCSYDFAANSVVTLTATPTSPSTFGGWSGASCSGTGTCIVTMSSAQSVTATFNAAPPGAFNKTSPSNGASAVATNPTLSWGTSSGATSYEYCYDTSNDNACSAWVSTGTTASANLSGLNPSTSYYWQVRANNATGTPTYADGSSTAYWSFTTAAGTATFTISGNAGVAGATLTYTGGSTSADGSGNYLLTVPSGWSGTVTPSMAGYTFTPVNRTYTNVISNQTAQNYTATAISTFTISGNAGVAGATLTYTGGSTSADGSGNYLLTVPSGWSGTVMPSKAGYTFTPVNRTYTNVVSNLTGQDYTATATGPTNLLQDPSFEAYTPNPYWSEVSIHYGTPLCTIAHCGTGGGTAGPRTGSVWAWFSGTSIYESDSLSQSVVFPSGSATLTFYLWIGAADPGSDTADVFSADIDGVTVFSANATQISSYSTYTLVSEDVSAFANGASHTVKFSSESHNAVNFNLDDAALIGPAAPPTTFADVPPTYWASSWITRLYNAGITSGCSTNPLSYCPDDSVTRDQMAIFLERGMHGSTYTPPAGTGMVFVDVPLSYWAVNWIEKLYTDGITGGCLTSPLSYCPANPVTRAQMAIFLLRAKHGASYGPPAAAGIFADVPTSHWAASWIEQLYAEGITGGCSLSPLSYCPEDSVTRAQMAKFLVITFNLP